MINKTQVNDALKLAYSMLKAIKNGHHYNIEEYYDNMLIIDNAIVKPKLTFKAVQKELSLLNITIRKTGYDDEYRVNIKGKPEARACYENCLLDAYASGLAIAREVKEVQAIIARNS